MRFTILGSGGCCSLPRPGCFCRVCEEARVKGHPWARYGPSLFCGDANLLVDTPEDIVHALNYSRVPDVENVIYTHPDPDHTMGMRVFEQLRLDWYLYGTGRYCENPVNIYALPGTMRFLKQAGCGYGSSFEYYEKMRIARLCETDKIECGGVCVTLIPVDDSGRVSVVLFEKDGKKLVYAPCDCMPFPKDERLFGADVLILGNTMHGTRFRGDESIVMTSEMAEKCGLYTPEAAMALSRELRAGEMIFTHLEEDWNLSFTDYQCMQADTPGVRYAYDGMTIEL